jgi:hypothetical protein
MRKNVAARPAAWTGICAVGAALLLGSIAVPAAAKDTPDAPKPGPAAKIYPVPVDINLDYSTVPDLKDWAEHVKLISIAWYPVIARILDSPGYTPPKKFNLTFKETDGIAYTGRDGIVCAAKWFRDHPDDYGAVVHEVAHVVQSYPKYNPVWLVEGIADYVRWFNYEPPAKRPVPDPAKAKYTDSYQTTGAFLDWVQKNEDPEIVYRLNAALRKGAYSPDLWSVKTGKSVDEMWKDFAATLPKREPKPVTN